MDAYHEGNTEEENNGYVVFIWYITDQLGDREGEALLRPSLLQADFWTDI